MQITLGGKTHTLTEQQEKEINKILEKKAANEWFEPKDREDYYFLTTNGKVECYFNNESNFDLSAFNFQRVYRTKDEALSAIAKQQALTNIQRYISKNMPFDDLDWGNGEQYKFRVIYIRKYKKFCVVSNNESQEVFLDFWYVSSKEKCEQLITDCEADFKVLFDVE